MPRFGLLSLAALTGLIAQNTLLVVVMKHTYRSSAQSYSSAVAVMLAEILKFTICLARLASSRTFLSKVKFICDSWRESVIVLPTILYVIQNNLLYYGVKKLPVVVYIVCLQLKTLTTAAFSVLLLRTSLNASQIFALVLLVSGVILVQVGDMDGSSQVSPSLANEQILGFAAVLIATLTSGLAGVLLEKLYKSTGAGEGHDLWTRNLQMSCLSIPIASFAVLYQDYNAIAHFRIFAGVDYVVLLAIFLQGVGGILIAYVMKFASSLLKCFAIAISICCCAVLTPYTQAPSHSVWFGIMLVNMSVVLYYVKPSLKQILLQR